MNWKLIIVAQKIMFVPLSPDVLLKVCTSEAESCRIRYYAAF